MHDDGGWGAGGGRKGTCDTISVYIKKTRKPKKKVVYISETDSDDEEVVYKKKSKKKEAIIQDLNIKDVRKKDDEKLLEKQYNDKLSKIKQEFLMDQLFPK